MIESSSELQLFLPPIVSGLQPSVFLESNGEPLQKDNASPLSLAKGDFGFSPCGVDCARVLSFRCESENDICLPSFVSNGREGDLLSSALLGTRLESDWTVCTISFTLLDVLGVFVKESAGVHASALGGEVKVLPLRPTGRKDDFSLPDNKSWALE